MPIDGRSDVLIVGAGPTGCAAGIVLARAGADVCVVDRARFPRDKTCGDALSNATVKILYELGVGDELAGGPHAEVRRAAAVFPDGTRVTRDYDPPGWIIPRLRFDDCLRRALERSGARLLQGVRIAELRRDGDRVVGARGTEIDWTAPIVIAADGYGTIGLAALDRPQPDGRHLAVSATAYYRGIAFPDGATTADHCFDAELPYGYGWIFPAVDGVSNVGVYLRADAYAGLARNLRALLEDFLARHAARFGGAEPVGKPRAWSLPIGPRPIPHAAPGLLLAGDAGGFVDPLSGEGIWQGLHSGVVAAEIALQAVSGGGLDRALVRRYERRCWREIGRQSRAKAIVQRGIAQIVRRRLYRSAAVRAALTWGYRRQTFEVAKT